MCQIYWTQYVDIALYKYGLGFRREVEAAHYMGLDEMAKKKTTESKEAHDRKL